MVCVKKGDNKKGDFLIEYYILKWRLFETPRELNVATDENSGLQENEWNL